jgi:splicing factor 3B subunit 1
MEELKRDVVDPSADPMDAKNPRRISDRESSYQAQRLKRELSPERVDPFAREQEGRNYAEVMRSRELEREQRLREKEREPSPVRGKRRRWDEDETKRSEWEPRERKSRWEETPKNSWDATPKLDDSTAKRSRWDQTPTTATPVGNLGMATPSAEQLAQMTPFEQMQLRNQMELDYRNRPLSDQELNNMIPVEGFKILEPPEGYNPIKTPARKLMDTPLPMDGQAGFFMQDDKNVEGFGAAIPYIPGVDGLNYFKADDMKHFSKLMEIKDDYDMSTDEIKERKIMRMLLKIKNGQPNVRKQAMRQITENARLFGAQALFNQILPLMMSPTLEEQERHMLVNQLIRSRLSTV